MSIPSVPGSPQRGRRKRWIAIGSVVVLVAAAVIAVSVWLGGAGGEVAGSPTPTTTPTSARNTARSTPPSAAPSTSSSTHDSAHIPGWTTVTAWTASYDVPPGWTRRDRHGSNGSAFQDAVYRPGYCAGHANSLLGRVITTRTDIKPASKAVREEAERYIRKTLGSTKPKINWGKLNKSEDDLVAVLPAEVRSAAPGTCQSPATLVLARSWSNADRPGGAIFLVVADQEVPGAESVHNLEKIANSFRGAGT
ncbi:hypothetical protein [Sciscionella marina]|uniref:hypothetical protein n=1 Tax=Sciscionella marina TaxID=508770 RepID=UPI000374A09A|nr:hypothetical protein [Sciscionella marina]